MSSEAVTSRSAPQSWRSTALHVVVTSHLRPNRSPVSRVPKTKSRVAFQRLPQRCLSSAFDTSATRQTILNARPTLLPILGVHIFETAFRPGTGPVARQTHTLTFLRVAPLHYRQPATRHQSSVQKCVHGLANLCMVASPESLVRHGARPFHTPHRCTRPSERADQRAELCPSASKPAKAGNRGLGCDTRCDSAAYRRDCPHPDSTLRQCAHTA